MLVPIICNTLHITGGHVKQTSVTSNQQGICKILKVNQALV